MKKILILAPAIALALLGGCGRRGAANANSQETTEQHIHNHSACGDDHSHEAHAGHNHAGHSHDAHAGHNHAEHSNDDAHAGHSHAPGESCGHDHSGDSHAGHDHAEADNHSHDAHAGHDHAADDNKSASKSKKRAAEADPHAGHDHGTAEAVDPDEIVFPAAQAARTDFEVKRAARATFAEVIKCGGQISAAQNELTVVAAPVAGIVTPFDGRIMASTPVKKGQELFTLASGGLASGDAANKARINYEQAKANFERTEELYKDKLVTQSEYLDAQAQYLTAQTEYEPLKRSDGRGGIIINAPANGYIAQMAVTAGDFVEMGAPLATIARSGRMQLKALVSQSYFDRLPQIADANFRVSSSSAYYNVKQLNGSLYNAGRIVSSGSALIPVVFEMDNNGALPDGAFVEVSLLGRPRQEVLTLPLTAITEQQGLYYVYVQLDADCYARREVTLGPDDGVNVEILSGISEGDPVVTRGAVNVKMASASGAIPHGHTH